MCFLSPQYCKATNIPSQTALSGETDSRKEHILKALIIIDQDLGKDVMLGRLKLKSVRME